MLNAIPSVEKLAVSVGGDVKTGVKIVQRALEEPIRQIAKNAGLEGSVIIDKIKRARKVGYGFNAANETYGDMMEMGIVDPTKVSRSALQNAASVAAMVLTTESLVSEEPKEEPAAPAAAAWAACIKKSSNGQPFLKNPASTKRWTPDFLCLQMTFVREKTVLV